MLVKYSPRPVSTIYLQEDNLNIYIYYATVKQEFIYKKKSEKKS